MTYWLYDIKKLASPSTLIPYKQKDIGDFLNFLSVLCAFVYIYLLKTKNLEKYGKIVLFLLTGIFFTGVIMGTPSNKNINTSIFGNYENSLYID
jgi:hypothetical protein